jgi:hypothetical protein
MEKFELKDTKAGAEPPMVTLEVNSSLSKQKITCQEW